MSAVHLRRPWAPLAGAVLVVAGSAVAAFMIAAMTHEGVMPGPGFGTFLTLACLVSFVGAGMTLRVRRTETDRSLLPAFALLGVGGGLGTAVSAALVGTSWVPLLVLFVAAGVIAAVWWAREQRIHRLLAHGRRVAAVFAEVTRGSADGTSMYEEVGYRISYRDESGQERELSGTGGFPSSRLPRAGDGLTLWYDPARPSRHLVRLASDDDVSDGS